MIIMIRLLQGSDADDRVNEFAAEVNERLELKVTQR